ncbi:MAG: hypothetical protein AB7F67_11655 [Rhodospirillaceae bacterium]
MAVPVSLWCSILFLVGGGYAWPVAGVNRTTPAATVQQRSKAPDGRAGILAGRAPPTFIVHGLAHALAAARAAAAAGVAVRLMSAAGAGGYAGAAWFAALVDEVRRRCPEARIEATLDCADAPGHALAALRQGVRLVGLRGNRRAVAAVADIAGRLGGAIDRRRGAALDLAHEKDPDSACVRHLSTGRRARGRGGPHIAN